MVTTNRAAHFVRTTERSSEGWADSATAKAGNQTSPATAELFRADRFIEGGRGPAFDARVQTRLPGGVEAEAFARGPRLDFRGQAEASVSRSGIDVELSLDVNATLLEAGANGRVRIPVEVSGETMIIEVDLQAEGVVGARGRLELDLHIGTNGRVSIHAGGEGFAGARAGLTGSVSVEHEGRKVVSGSLEVSASAGVAASGTLDIDLSRSGVEFQVGGELTGGVGFGVETRGSVDAGNVARLLTEVVAGTMRDGFSVNADALREIGGWAGDRFGDVRERIAGLTPRNIDWTPWN